MPTRRSARPPMRARSRRVAVEVHALAVSTRAGLIGPTSPRRLLAMARAMRDYGTLGGAIVVAGMRHGERPGLVDELGTVSFAELDRRSNALANAWRAQGIAEGTGIGILCRNHRGLLDDMFAAAKIGARTLFLNTEFAAPQATDVCRREGVDVLVHDEEFTRVVADVAAPKGRFVAWHEPASGAATLDNLIGEGDPSPPPAPSRAGSLVVLTSGTSGTPKGAQRSQPKGLAIPGALLSKVPLRSGGVTYVAPPIFHGLGLLLTSVSLALGNTVVTRRRFEPEQVVAALAEHRCDALVVVPVMLKRIVALGATQIAEHDSGRLRIIATGGAQLGAPLAVAVTGLFGDVIHNIYGSTEAAYATIATPADLAAEPGCVGRAPVGTVVKILDPDDSELPAGRTGRIFVGNAVQSSGYTGGGTKQFVRGLMATGDVGHFDARGLLFVDGRDDDMIVSGGENVFPGEVTDLLVGHPDVLDAAVIGVLDEDFGQALRAFVVPRAAGLTEQAIKGYVKQNLARYKVPRSVVFLDALPRNAAGKIVKRELVEPNGADLTRTMHP